jgi:site-specific DNA-cytosine methylase
MLLQSLDLFSGVGGLTRSLEGIAEPVSYCDIAPESLANLTANMGRKLIPRAPISTDVRSLDKKWLKNEALSNGLPSKKPTMVVAGFPCVGFSSVGKRQAFENSQSSLFSEVLRIIDEFKLPVAFLENVPGILNLGMGVVVHELVTKRGFEMRWCVVSAEDVGAPQVRRRWFCLCVKPGFAFDFAGQKYKPYAWSKGFPAADRMACRTAEQTREERLRIGLLGNSVVPDAVRMAFAYLASGFAASSRPDQRRIAYAKSADATATLKPTKSSASMKWPQAGLATRSGKSSSPEIFGAPRVQATAYVQAKRQQLQDKNFRIVLDPKSFKPKKPPSVQLVLPVLKKTVQLKHWATPRYSNTAAVNYITRRTKGDLPTQARFEKETPAKLRACELEARFVEWLMGYPRDWTRQH